MTSPVLPPAPADPTSLASGDYTSAIILNRIFALLSNMITPLQNAAAAQADRLNFDSQWQKAYTDVMSQVPTFQESSGPFAPGSANNTTAQNQLSNLNTLNSNYIQDLQNRQSLVSDDAKALQSDVNQSNDAVNSQTSLGTAILQELGTLIQGMFQ